MTTPNETFDRMSKLLTDNTSAGFGGAAVIVFPSSAVGGPTIEPIEMLILDPKCDVAQFLATLKTRLEMVQQEIQGPQRFGR